MLRVEFDHNDGQDPTGWNGGPTRALFNCTLKPPDKTHTPILRTWPYLGLSHDYSDWRLCQYLPLQDATGLSIYCEIYGVCGIVVHGKSPQLVGRRTGQPLYFHFSPGEHLTFLAVSISRFNPEIGPFPMVSFPLYSRYSCCSEMKPTDHDQLRTICPVLPLLPRAGERMDVVYTRSPRSHHWTCR